MNTQFLDFWHLYAPRKEFSNRYLACKRLWEEMDEAKCEEILRELTQKRSKEQIPEVYEKYLLAQHVALAVCRNPQTNCFGTVTKTDAELYQLEVHHYME